VVLYDVADILLEDIMQYNKITERGEQTSDTDIPVTNRAVLRWRMKKGTLYTSINSFVTNIKRLAH